MKNKLSWVLLIVSLMFITLVIPSVSAFNWNPFGYDKQVISEWTGNSSEVIPAEIVDDYPIVEINSQFLWMDSGVVASYQLLTNTEECLIDCESTGRVQLFRDSTLFEDVSFKNVAGETTSISSYNFYVEQEVEKEMTVDEMGNCTRTIPENETNAGEEVIYDCVIGSHTETYTVKEWINYPLGDTLPAGYYNWKITGQKNPNEAVDWIAESTGHITLDEYAWWGGSNTWSKRQFLNITGSNITLNNFTVYVNVPYDSDMRSDFGDIRFMDGTGASLSYERESYVASTSGVFWVRIPTLNPGSGNNTVYMYYGNPSATTTSSGPNTFTSAGTSLYAVNHLNDTNYKDTMAGKTATLPYGTPPINTTAPSIFGAPSTISNNDIEMGSNTEWDDFTREGYNFAYETWIYVESYNTTDKNYNGIWGATAGGCDFSGFQPYLQMTTDGNFTANSGKNCVCDSTPSVSGVVALQTWHHVVYVYTSTNTHQVYVDGVGMGAKSMCSSGTSPYAMRAPIGGYYADGSSRTKTWQGKANFDEWRAYNGLPGGSSDKTASWIAREYQNINSSTITRGTEEALTGAWTKKKLVTITENANLYNLQNYTVILNVTYDNDMQPDFDDLKFTNFEQNKELPYWISSKVNSNSAIVYVLIGNLTQAGTKQIYMQYGNPYVSASSDESKSYWFYDGFNDNHITSYTLLNGGGGASWDMNSGGNGLLRQTGSDPSSYAEALSHKIWNTSTGKGLEVTAYYQTPDHDYLWYPTSLGNLSNTIAVHGPMLDYDHWEYGARGDCVIWQEGGGTYCVSPANWNDANWHTDQLRYFEKSTGSPPTVNWSGSTDGTYRIGAEVTGTSNSYPGVGKQVVIGTDHSQLYLDWIKVREYISPEPTGVFGSELGVDSSWQKKQIITIKGGAETLYNFTVYIPVTKNENMKSDFGDIRFVNSSETGELSYELDSYNSTFAGFWVLMPTLTTGSNTIYMYYDNPFVTTTSNASTTWPDYEGASEFILHMSTNTSVTVDTMGHINWTVNGAMPINASNAIFGTGSIYQYNKDSATGSNNLQRSSAVISNGVYTTATFNAFIKNGVNARIHGRGTTSITTQYLAYINSTGGLDSLYTDDGACGTGGGSGVVNYNDGNVHLFTYLWTPSVTQWYSDGKLEKTCSNDGPNGGGTGGDWLMASYHTNSNIQNLTMDEARYVNKQLTSAEINRTWQNANFSNVVFGTEENPPIGGGISFSSGTETSGSYVNKNYITVGVSGATNVTVKLYNSANTLINSTTPYSGSCGQETDNNNTLTDGGCGLKYDGSYLVQRSDGYPEYSWCDGAWWLGHFPQKIYDGDWNTKAHPCDSFYTDYLTMYYTKPAGALNTSIWMVKDGNATANLTIPGDCWNANSQNLTVRASAYGGGYSYTYFVTWSCYNGTSWNSLRYTGNCGDASLCGAVYEEKMFWDVSNSINFNNLSDGLYYFNATESVTNTSTETRNVTLDTTSPILQISYPLSTLYFYNVTNLTGSFSEPNVDSVWYSLDKGVTNVTTTSYSSGSCYQETANVSTSCGGLAGGNYTVDGTWTSSSGYETLDENWGTYASGYSGGCGIADSRLYGGASFSTACVSTVYQKPVGALSTSLWQIKGYQVGPVNVSIPSDCWNYDPNYVYVRLGTRGFDYRMYWSCKNQSTGNWKLIDYGGTYNYQYEEAMNWNLGIINVTGLTSVEGKNNWSLYVKDKSGHISSSNVSFEKDSSPLLSCGMNLTLNGTTYTMNQSISSGGTCLTIQNDTIYINARGYNITGNIDASGPANTNAYTNILINNLTLIGDYYAIGPERTTGCPAHGFPGGAVNFTNSKVTGAINTHGGGLPSCGSAKNGGVGGAITLTNTNVSGTMTSYGGKGSAQSSGGKGGNGGLITMIKSNASTINNYGGNADGFGAASACGNDCKGGGGLFNSSVFGSLDSHGGSDAPTVAYSSGPGGDIVVINSTFTSIDLHGGAPQGGGTGGKGGNMNISDSIISSTSTINMLGNPDSINGTLTWNNTYLRKVGYGLVKLNDFNSTQSNIMSILVIGNNSVSINSVTYPTYANVGARITLYGERTNYTRPVILRDGINCPSSICTNLTALNLANITFTVTGWSNYSEGEYANYTLVIGNATYNQTPIISGNQTWEENANLTFVSDAPVTNWFSWLVGGIEYLAGIGENVFNWVFNLPVDNPSALVNLNTYLPGVANVSCYQEQTNITTVGDGSCNLNYTGAYWSTNAGIANSSAYDANWDTYSDNNYFSMGYMDVNYTKPINATGAYVNWKFNETYIKSYPLPQACWNTFTDKIVLYFYADNSNNVAAICANESSLAWTGSWQNLDGSGGDVWDVVQGSHIWEESVNWTVPGVGPGILDSNQTVNITTNSTNPSLSITYPTSTNYIQNVDVLNYTITDATLRNVWYSIDSGVTNITVPKPGECYQEFTNQSSSSDTCTGLNYSGVNWFTGAGWGYTESPWTASADRGYDGDWDTGVDDGSNNGWLYANYSVPVGAVNTSKWIVRGGQPATIKNLTINSSCWDNAISTKVLELRLRATSLEFNEHSEFLCKNATDWVTIAYLSDGGQFKEEAMRWNISSSITGLSSIEGSNTWKIWANDSVGNQNSSFVTFNVTFYPEITFINQTPADITSINAVSGGVSINYNITDNIEVNLSSIQFFYKQNSTTRDVITFVNGTPISDYYLKDYTSNSSSTFLWNLYDNQIYPATYNLNETLMETTAHTTQQLTANANLVAIQLLNITNTTQYNFFEVMSNSTSTQRVYYCNNSFTTNTNPTTATYCILLTTLPANNPYNHTHTIYSKHQVIPIAINTIAGTLGGVKVTPTSWFILRGNAGAGNQVNYYTIPTTSRQGATRTSTNTGSSWTNQTYTVDSHLHQFSGNSSLWYYVCASDNLNNNICSTPRQDLYELAGLPPTQPIVYSPVNSSYRGVVNVNYTASESPNGYPISNYNITLWNSGGTFNQTLRGTGTTLSYAWDTSTIGDGYFYIIVEANDSINQKSYGQSETFLVDNIIPLINFTSPTETSGSIIGRNYIIVNLSYSDLHLDNVTVNLYNSGGTLINTTSPLNRGLCYQEKADNSTVGDGSCTLDYSGTTTMSNAYGNGHATVTYKKPVGAVNSGTLWRVKHGENMPEYNVSIPQHCWDYSPTNISFWLQYEIGPNGPNYAGTSEGRCYNGTGWTTITNSYSMNMPWSWPYGGSCPIFDGDWNTGCTSYIGTWWGGGNATFYEESLYWNMNSTQVSFTGLTSGLYYFNATAIDLSGNSNSTETRNVTVDVTAPTAVIVDPLNNTISNQPLQNFTINLSDTNGLANATLNIYNQTGLYNQTTVSLGGIFQTLLGIPVFLIDGIYNWFWQVVDIVGNTVNTQTTEGNKTITMDTISPMITIVSPTTSSYSYPNILINVTITDPRVDKIWYNWNGVNESWVTPVEEVFTEGVRTLHIYANDTAGNVNHTQVTFIVDLTTPLVSITYPQATNYTTNVSTLTFTASDTNGQIAWYSTDGGVTNTTTYFPSLCYQEQANRSDSSDGNCGQSYTGVYYGASQSGGGCPGENCIDNSYDGNWTDGKYGYRPQLSINYTIPSKALSSSIWRVSNDEGGPVGRNISLSNCTFGNTLSLKVYSHGSGFNYYTDYQCLINGTYTTLYTYSAGETGDHLYEEGIYWNISGVVTGLTSNEGYNTWVVGVNDSAGNKNSSSVTFFKDSINPQINFTTPTEISGSYINRDYVVVNLSVVDTNLKNVTTTLYVNSMGKCYQESANVPNQKGTDGSCGLSYTGNYSTNGTYSFTNSQNFYVDYTKPIGSLNTSSWHIKVGNSTNINSMRNVSVPIDCWDYNNTKLSFRIQSNYYGGSYPEGNRSYAYISCWNGTWEDIEPRMVTEFETGWGAGCDWTTLYDGDYTTGCGTQGWGGWENPGYASSGDMIKVYDEAMIWDMNTTTFDPIMTQSVMSTPYTYTFGNLSNGIYYFDATATDILGNTNTTEMRNVTLDSVAPQISITYPQNINYTYNVTSLNYTIVETNPATCWYSLNSGVTNITVTCGNNLTDLTSNEGTNTWTVWINDTVSNVNSSTVTFFKDSITPLISFSSPTPTDGSYLNYNSLDINLSVTDTNFKNVTIYLYNSGEVLINSSDTLSYNFTNLPDGLYYYNATTYDILDNTNSTETRNVTIDITLPQAVIIAPLNNTMTNQTTQNFTINLTDNIGLNNATLNVYNTTGLYNQTTVSLGGIFQTLLGIPVFLIDGVYHWFWDVTDLANNPITTQTTEGNKTITIDSTSPMISIISPTAQNYNYSSVLVNISVNDLYVNTVWFNWNGSNQVYTPGVPVYVTFPDGNHVLDAYANDSAGNQNHTQVTFDTDTTYPVITISTPKGLQGLNYNKTAYNVTLDYTASDTYLQSCWYNSTLNSTITPTVCNTTQTLTDPDPNYQTVYVYANDTDGHTTMAESTWAPRATINSVVYNKTVFAGTLTHVVSNFTINYPPTNVVVHYYNETLSASTLTNDGSSYTVTNDLTAPILVNDTNVTFYYTMLVNGTNMTSINYTQTVNSVLLGNNCTGGNFVFLNITNYVEESPLTKTNGTMEYHIWLTNNGVLVTEVFGTSSGVGLVCTNKNISESTLNTNVQLRFWGDGFVYKTYNVQESSAQLFPLNLNLYYLNTSLGTQFKINYVDFNYLKYPGALVQIQRQYLDDNTYKVVEIPQVSNDGSAKGSFNMNNVRYKIIIINKGEILDTFENVFPACQNIILGTCELNLRGTEDRVSSTVNDFTYTLVKGNNTLTLTYVIPSGIPRTVTFSTNQNSRFISNLTSCSNSVTFASGGTITCGYNDTVGDSLIDTRIDISTQPSLYGTVHVSEDLSGFYMLNNYVIGFVLLLSLALIFISSGVMIVIVAVVGMMFLGAIFLLRGFDLVTIASSLMWLVIGAVIIIYKISQKEERT